jgi:hypothetical protein
MSQARNLLEIWDLYSKQVLTEKAKTVKMNTKPGPKPMDLNDKKVQGFAFKNSGPGEASGVNKDIIDTHTMSDKQKKEHAFEVDRFTLAGENFDKNMEKTTKAHINNNMNSTFDKLFEEVMDGNEQAADLDALGIGDDAGEDMGGEEIGGDITVTLTADQVECLRAILAQVDTDEGLGDEGLEDMGGEDLEGEDMGGEDLGSEEDADGEEDAEEDEHEVKKESTIVEANMKTKGKGHGKLKGAQVDGKGKDLPDKVGMMTGKNNKVGDKTSSLSSKGKGPGEGKVGSTVDGKGSAVADSAGLGLTKHGANKPHSKITGNNQEFFGV